MTPEAAMKLIEERRYLVLCEHKEDWLLDTTFGIFADHDGAELFMEHSGFLEADFNMRPIPVLLLSLEAMFGAPDKEEDDDPRS